MQKALLLLTLLPAAALAQTSANSTRPFSPPTEQIPLVLSHVELAKTRSLPNGIATTINDAAIEITALRPDVLRVRIGRNGQLPEDASWAVLPAARTSTSPTTRETIPDAVGFHTKALRVILMSNGILRVTDLENHILMQDTRPVEYHGNSFRLYKAMRADEHFFGLGDKTGPLDRRNQAFTNWNTDYFGFQESSDPIYKSIPFFISFNQGRALGVLFDNTFRASFDFGKEYTDAYSFGAPDGPTSSKPTPGSPAPPRSHPSGPSASSNPATATIPNSASSTSPTVSAKTRSPPTPSTSTSTTSSRTVPSPSIPPPSPHSPT
jgi:alpha-glucosidase